MNVCITHMRWLPLVLAFGCVTHHRIEVTGNAIGQQADALRTAGRASVIVDHIRDGEDHAWDREVITIDQRIGPDDESHVVRDIVAKCTGTDCRLDGLGNLPMRVREYETRSIMPAVRGTIGTLLVGGAIATVACGIACDEGTTALTVTKVSAIAYGGLVVGAIGYIIYRCLADGDCLD